MNKYTRLEKIPTFPANYLADKKAGFVIYNLTMRFYLVHISCVQQDLKHITQEEKSELIRKHKKKLLVEITILDQLGVDCGSILIDEDNELSNYGSRRGIACINSSSKIDSQFRKYFGKRDLYNKADVKAIGSKSARVPHLKGNFILEGLPEGIEWRKKNGNIKKPLTSEARRGDVATRAINDSPKVEASEVDVLITFREEEYEEMMAGHVWCFTSDALWVIRNGSSGAIVATFTSSPKKFWLFHFEEKFQDLNSIEQRQSIPGYWLQQA
eukprot:gene2310-2660_t